MANEFVETTLVDGFADGPHITEKQVGLANQGLYGPDDYVLSSGRKSEAQVLTNNSIRIFDAVYVIQGRRDVIAANDYTDVGIDNGAQGMNRNDIIVRRYTKDNSSEIEKTEYAVIKGTPTSGTASDPSVPTGDIRGGALLHNMKLYRVKLNGLNLVAVEPLFKVLLDMSTINKDLSELSSDFTKMKNYIVEEGSNSNGKYRKWNDGTLEMWFSSPFTCAIGTKAGSIYTSGQFTLNFPVASKTKCNIVLTIGAGGAIWGKVYGSANNYKTSFSYHLLAATVWNTASFDLSYYARGTWK